MVGVMVAVTLVCISSSITQLVPFEFGWHLGIKGCEFAHVHILCLGMCGDERVGATEECDDGNTASGDGCSATCTNEGFNAHKLATLLSPQPTTTTVLHQTPQLLPLIAVTVLLMPMRSVMMVVRPMATVAHPYARMKVSQPVGMQVWQHVGMKVWQHC